MFRGGLAFLGIGLIGLALGGCSGKSDSASGKLSFQEQIARAQSETDPAYRARRLIVIGYRQGKAADRAGAVETLKSAWKDCGVISDAAARSNVWSLMAEAHAGLRNRSEARRAVAEALTAAEKIESAEGKVVAMARAAEVQYLAVDRASAEATLRSAEKLAKKIDDPQGTPLAMCAIAEAYWNIDQKDQAKRVLGAALDFANSLTAPRKRCLALAEIAAAEANLGRRKAATKTFELSLESARGIEDLYARVYAMDKLAKKLSAAGFHAMAHEVLDQAESEAAKIPQPDLQRQALEKIRVLMGELPKG